MLLLVLSFANASQAIDFTIQTIMIERDNSKDNSGALILYLTLTYSYLLTEKGHIYLITYQKKNPHPKFNQVVKKNLLDLVGMSQSKYLSKKGVMFTRVKCTVQPSRQFL